MPDPIAVADIAAAETLAGVRYTPGERAAMADTLAAQIDLAQRRRAMSLPHDLPPATLFDPRPSGWSPPPDGPFRPVLAAPGPLPEDEADIAFAPVARLAGWIAAGALTSERLVGIYLDRIRRYGPALECVATVTADVALAQARRADALLAAGTHLGPLHGIPWGCKDILDTAGIVTGWGAEPWADRVPDADATVVRRLAEAGAVLIAKTTVGALAYGDIWYGGRTPGWCCAAASAPRRRAATCHWPRPGWTRGRRPAVRCTRCRTRSACTGGCSTRARCCASAWRWSGHSASPTAARHCATTLAPESMPDVRRPFRRPTPRC